MPSAFTAEISVSGLELGPTTSEKAGVGHLHWSFDDCSLDSGIEGGESSIEMELLPGEHTICVGAFSSDHEELGARDQITVIVDGAPPTGSNTTTGEGEEGTAVERWDGTIQGDIKSGPDCTEAENNGELILDVYEDGSVLGSGFVKSTEYTCTTPQGTSTIPPGSSNFGITGTKGQDAFELTFSDGLTMTIPYSGSSGSGSLDQSVGEYIATSSVEIECKEGC